MAEREATTPRARDSVAVGSRFDVDKVHRRGAEEASYETVSWLLIDL